MMQRTICGALLVVALGASAAEPVTIERGGCAAPIRLVARGVPLRDVLTSLSTALGFELKLVATTNSVVDVDVSRPAADLVASLSPADNIVVMQARDPACPGGSRIVKVWLLGKGSASAISTAASAPPPPRPVSEAEQRQIKEADEMYRRAHGMPVDN